jgi:hypothetical protein
MQAESDARRLGQPAPDPGLFATAGPSLDEVLERSAKGRLARKNGEVFEGRCVAACAIHSVHLFKIPSGCRWIGKGDPIPVKTPFDFAGCVPAMGGRGIFFDAKHISPQTHVGSITVGTWLVKKHQAEALRTMGAGKALAGLVMECGPVGDVRWLDWRFLRMGDEIPWNSPKWFILSPIAAPVDFGALVRGYEG